MGLIPPSLIHEIDSKFSELRKEVAIYITIQSDDEKADCPNCITSIEDSSLNIYNSSFTTPVVIFDETITPTPFSRGRCPICHGKGYLSREVSTEVEALVRWNPPDYSSRGFFTNGSGGLEGKNVARIKIDKCYYELVRDSIFATISGVKCELVFPPVFRSAGSTDYTVIAYYVAVEPGHSVRG